MGLDERRRKYLTTQRDFSEEGEEGYPGKEVSHYGIGEIGPRKHPCKPGEARIGVGTARILGKSREDKEANQRKI